MPLGDIDAARFDQHLPLTQVRAQLARRFTLQETGCGAGGPARERNWRPHPSAWTVAITETRAATARGTVEQATSAKRGPERRRERDCRDR